MKKTKMTRKNAQEHALFNVMADCAPVLLWMSRIDSLCIFFNKTWLDFTGRTIEQEWGVGWLEGVHFEDFQHCADTYTAHFNERTSFEMEYRLRRHDGEYRWILDRGVPYYGVEDEFLGFIGSCIDITEIKNAAAIVQQSNIELEQKVVERTASLKQSEHLLEIAKNKAEEATRLKSLFVSTVSHELRTPLTAIKSALELVMQGVKGKMPTEMEPLIEMSARNTDRMQRLINDILDIERIEAGQFTLAKKPQLLLPLIELALASNAVYADKFQVHLQVDKVVDGAMAQVDADRFIQVLDNLLSNAIKFTRPKTKVIVSMRRHGRHIRISVKDCGEGITSELIPRIFERFMQKEGSSTVIQKGTGLGLSIAKSIIEQHQGSIRFKTSTAGSTFFIELPEWQA